MYRPLVIVESTATIATADTDAALNALKPLLPEGWTGTLPQALNELNYTAESTDDGLRLTQWTGNSESGYTKPLTALAPFTKGRIVWFFYDQHPVHGSEPALFLGVFKRSTGEYQEGTIGDYTIKGDMTTVSND